MGFNLSQYMNMPVPQVGNEAGPQYATDVNNSLTIVDAHDHTAGSGVQITPNGLNINADLSMQSNNLTVARTVRFTPQGAVLTNPADVGCLYEVINDLYYNDGLGNNVRITQSGGVAGTSGSISGLVPPATASYSSISKTFIFQSDTNKAANIDGGAFIFRTLNTSSPGLTLQAPSSISGDYTITLPALPLSTLPISIDSSGVMGAALITYTQLDSTITSKFSTPIVYLSEVQASGVSGGTFTAGSYLTRTLNTLTNPTGYSWVSLSANQFTLQAGTYDIYVEAPCVAVNLTKCRVQNITDAATAILGQTSDAGSAGGTGGIFCTAAGVVTVASAKVFEVQHRCDVTGSGDGFGHACSFGDSEIYTTVRIQKITP